MAFLRSFSVCWRNSRRAHEFAFHIAAEPGALIAAALESGGGLEIWRAGMLWKCPGCGDCTLRTEEFLEGLRLAGAVLQKEEEIARLDGGPDTPARRAAIAWIADVTGHAYGCERDRVYLKDEGGSCRYAQVRFTSRI